MNLHYFANILLPTEKAHGIQIMEMCSAFQKIGYPVNLYVAKRHQTNKNITDTSPFFYYGIDVKFSIHFLPVIDLLFLPLTKIAADIAFFTTQICFTLHSLFVNINSHDVTFTRDKLIVLAFSLMRKTAILVYEAHDSGRLTWLDSYVAIHSSHIVAISKSIEKSWQALGANTIYAPDGVSTSFFINETQDQCRSVLNLPNNQRIAVYTGNIFAWKGIDTLLEAFRELPLFSLYIVGGEGEQEFANLKQQYVENTNIHFIGNRPHGEIPTWLRAADLLIIPNSAKTKKGREDTSPLKLFEYLASGTSILASRVAAITEIISEKNAHFFEADNISSCRIKIEKIMSQPVKKSELNQDYVRQFSWEKRAQFILDRVTR